MARRLRRPKQLAFTFRTWGGKRLGAGRKRAVGLAASRLRRVPHRKRPLLNPKHPLHVTIRVRDRVLSLRRRDTFARMTNAIAAARERLGMRLCHFAVLGNHAHFLVEADDKRALSRAMKGLGVRIAKSLNRLMRALRLPRARGAVYFDRYDAAALDSPTRTARALAYLADNAHHHGFASPGPDAFTSFAHPDLVAAPHTWLLARGFRRGRVT